MKLNRRTARHPATYSAIIFFVLVVALIALATRPSQPEAGASLADVNLDSLTILHVGGGDLATQLVHRLEEAGGRVVRSPGIPEAPDLGPEVIVVFGGEWFEQRAYDPALHDFLRLASSRGASLVMADGTTTVFFEVLDMAGLYGIPVTETGEVRNPAYFNPALAGFRMKEVDGHTGPSFLLSMESSAHILAESLVSWIHGWSDGPLQPSTPVSEPHLRYVGEHNYSPLLDSDPHGRLNVTAAVYQLMYDGVADYDWYFYRIEVRSVSGAVAYSSAWRNDCTWAHHQVVDAGTNTWMGTRGPGTSGGTDTVHVFLRPWDTPIGSRAYDPQGWRYSIDGVVVLAQGSYLRHRVSWLHDIDRSAPTARDTYLSVPGFVVKTRQGYPCLVDAWYQVQFARQPLWWSTRTAGPSPTLMLDAFRGGD